MLLNFILKQTPTLFSRLSISDLKTLIATGNSAATRIISDHYQHSWVLSLLFEDANLSKMRDFNETEQMIFNEHIVKLLEKKQTEKINAWVERYAEHFINWMGKTPYYLNAELVGNIYSLIYRSTSSNSTAKPRVSLIRHFLLEWDQAKTLKWSPEVCSEDSTDIFFLLGNCYYPDLLIALGNKNKKIKLDLNKGPNETSALQGTTLAWRLAQRDRLIDVVKTTKSLKYSSIDLHASPTNPNHLDYGINVAWLFMVNKKFDDIYHTLMDQRAVIIDPNTKPLNPKNPNLGVSISYLAVKHKEENLLTLLSNRSQQPINMALMPLKKSHPEYGIPSTWWLAYNDMYHYLLLYIQQYNRLARLDVGPFHEEHPHHGQTIGYLYAQSNKLDLLMRTLQVTLSMNINTSPSHPTDINYGATALWWITYHGHSDQLIYILNMLTDNHNANFNAAIANSNNPNYGTTPAWWIALHGKMAVLDTLAEQFNLFINLNARADKPASMYANVSVAYLIAQAGNFNLLRKLAKKYNAVIDLNACPLNPRNTRYGKKLSELLIEADQVELLDELKAYRYAAVNELRLPERRENSGKRSPESEVEGSPEAKRKCN